MEVCSGSSFRIDAGSKSTSTCGILDVTSTSDPSGSGSKLELFASIRDASAAGTGKLWLLCEVGVSGLAAKTVIFTPHG
jgi:hypothetical protein